MKDFPKYFLFLSILIFINSQLQTSDQGGKCVFIFNDSAVYDFHYLKNDRDEHKYEDLNVITDSNNITSKYGWIINICNDTVAECLNISENDTNANISNSQKVLISDSLMIYRDRDYKCRRATGGFFDQKNSTNLTYHKDFKNFWFEYHPPEGDKCGDNDRYRTVIKFTHNRNDNKAVVHYKGIEILSDINTYGCDRNLNIELNLETPEYLLIQIMLNNYYLVTGFIFLIVGIFLMFLAKNKKAIKFIIGCIFAEILSFSIGCGIFGLSIKYMELVLAFVGIFVGCFIGYFCLGGNKLFKVILSITAGFIFGLFFFDIAFVSGNYQLTVVLLINTILIFIGLFIVVVQFLPNFHVFYDSVIGSYIFVRGMSVLLYKIGGKVRYRELQIILFLVNRHEYQYAEYFYQNKWKYYWVYDIFIFIFMGVSIYYYVVKLYGRDDYEEKDEEEENPEEKLIGGVNSTKIDEGEDDKPLE